MQIPFHKPYITEEEISAAVETIRNGWLTMGHKTINFEKDFAQRTDSKFSIALNSCTAALHLALICNDLKPGDKVIIPVNTFVATAEVIRYFDAIPVFCDIEPDTHNIDTNKVESLIDENVKGIIAVHYSGQPCDMDELIEICNRRNLFLVEDAAHAYPSFYKGRKVGSLSNFTAFSFYVTKTVVAGEGGCLNTNNVDFADKLKRMRLHGISKDAWNRYSKEGSWKYDVVELGYKYNPTDIASALAHEQLKRTEELQLLRENIAKRYNDAFNKNSCFELYHIKNDRKSSHHLYPLKLNLDTISINRDQFIDNAKKRGVNLSVHFIPLHYFSYYEHFSKDSNLNIAENIYERVFSLPIWPGMSNSEIDYVIETLISISAENKR